MATHRMPKKHRARKAVLVCAAGAGVSTALVLGHATNTTAANFMVQLTNTVIGAGGQGDPTSARVPDKLNMTVVPEGFEYYAVQYPATINLQASRDVGLPIMHAAISDRSDEEHLIVAAYSAGALIAEQVRRDLQAMDPADAPPATQLSFLQIGSPFAGNGGIYARFPGIGIPGITDAMGVGQATRYDTTYAALMYDTYADFPAYFNPFSLVNAALSIRYGHPDLGYDPIDPATHQAYVTTVHNSAGGTDTYYLYYSAHLPLLGPVRELAGMVFLTPFIEPVLSAVEPVLRLLVDMGYTDRVNANPATPTPFSLITPPAKILEALLGLPAALAQGATNLLTAGQTPTTIPNPLGNLVSVAPSAEDDGGSGTASLAAVPDAEPEADTEAEPELEADAEPEAEPEPDAEAEAEAEEDAEPEPDAEATSNDGRHPTVTSGGNKVTPGGAADATPTDDEPTDAKADKADKADKPDKEPADTDSEGDTASASAA